MHHLLAFATFTRTARHRRLRPPPMLHSIEFLCSVVVAFSRLVHVLRKALMAVPAPPAHAGVPPPCSSWRKVHRPAITVLDEKKASTKEVAAPPAVVLGACKSGNAEGAEERKAAQAARVRPPRLVIPVSSAAGRDAFGEAAGRRTDAVEKEADVEVEGEGFWLVSRRGMRHALEDGYGVITNKNGGDSQMAFYGVYDGHGGRAAVDFVSARLGRNIVAALAAMETQRSPEASQKPQEDDDDDRRPETTAVRAGYLITDSDFLSQGVRGGACAATALVKDGALYVANLGDCRAVISRDGVATALTTDQTAARGDERTRIESSGGYVSCKNGVWRVQDSLAVSRAFGDASMKEWVVAEPEIKMLRLTPECQFLVIASDGLWNKVSNQEAVDVVSRSNSKSTSSCKKLVDMARSRGSRDDITVMVVDLQRFVQRNRRNQYV